MQSDSLERLEARVGHIETVLLRCLSERTGVVPAVIPPVIPLPAIPSRPVLPLQRPPILPLSPTKPKIPISALPSTSNQKIQIQSASSSSCSPQPNQVPTSSPSSSSALIKDAQQDRDALDDLFFSTIEDVVASPTKKLLIPFSPLENALLDRTLDAQARTQELIGSIGDIDLRREDFLRLKDGELLNDELLNAWFQFLAKTKLHCFSFSTYFFQILQEKGYAGIKKWTGHVDIFAFKYLLFPIHLPGHWIMVAVDVEKKEVGYYDSRNGIDFSSSVIFQYLLKEHQWKHGTELDFQKWKLLQHKEIPQQRNSYDCGVFACMYAHSLAHREKITGFDQMNIPHLRQRMVLELLSASSNTQALTPNTRSKRTRKN